MNSNSYPGVTRRAMLKGLALAGCGAALPWKSFAAQPAAINAGAILNYLETLARPDGGYAWEDQEKTHLTPTYAVTGCYTALGRVPPRKQALAAYIRTHHPSVLKKLEQEHREFEYQQIQSLTWLKEDLSEFREKVSGWRKPTVYFKQYEQDGNPIFSHEVTAFTCRELLGMPATGILEYLQYVDSRRRGNGSFNSTPASDGSDGHVLNTWWGLEALRILGRANELKEQTIEWLRSCQLDSGGFTWSPKPEFAGVDDVAYTWAALKSLRLLGVQPERPDAADAYLRSLANADGGFGDRPGWRSNPMATFYALEALAALGTLDRLSITPKRARRKISLPSGLKIFSAQVEAHGQGSPADAVNLAKALRIHLWGAKNSSPDWLARAQQLADEQKLPVQFFVANEEYGTWVTVPGLGTYSHTSDIVAPAGADIGPSLAKKGVFSWQDFRTKRLPPLHKGKGRLIWQFGENEELVRLFLDDSVERGGFFAISTFHFGNPDFTNSEPFLMRYRGLISYIALQDAHGPEAWWFADKTEGFRTLFLGTEPTWEAWLTALKNNWTAAIRHDSVSSHQTWIHSGSREVLDFVRAHEQEWRWWDNPDIQRPMVSIAAFSPSDVLEVGHPAEGSALRIRCAWECGAHGQLKSPMAELLAVEVDGKPVPTKPVSRKAPKAQGLADEYHEAQLPGLSAGRHTAKAEVRVLKTGARLSSAIEFIKR
jgi:hypothetical protein